MRRQPRWPPILTMRSGNCSDRTYVCFRPNADTTEQWHAQRLHEQPVSTLQRKQAGVSAFDPRQTLALPFNLGLEVRTPAVDFTKTVTFPIGSKRCLMVRCRTPSPNSMSLATNA